MLQSVERAGTFQEDGMNYLGWMMNRVSMQIYFCASKSATGKSKWFSWLLCPAWRAVKF